MDYLEHTQGDFTDIGRKAMVAYDELGSLVPIKRTLQVIDCQNQASKELEVRQNCTTHCNSAFSLLIFFQAALF